MQIRLHESPLSEHDPTNHVEVLESFTNLGPIVDFCIVDLDKQGQGQVRALLQSPADQRKLMQISPPTSTSRDRCKHSSTTLQTINAA